MKGLSLPQMRAIDAVVTSGTFSGAAKLLGISQPSVSNHVTAVEARYKTQLFERNGHTIHPTDELDAILPKIRSMLVLVDELESNLNSKRALETGQLRVGYSTYQIAIPILTRFMHKYPAIQIEARAMASDDLMHHLDKGDLDVACMTAKEIPAHLAGRKICDVTVVVAVPEDHPLAKRESVPLRELAGIPLVQREKASYTRRLFDSQASIANLEMTTTLAVGSWGSIIELVRGGIGIGVGLDKEVTGEPGIVSVPISGPVMTAAQFLVHLPERRMISAVQAFLETATHTD